MSAGGELCMNGTAPLAIVYDLRDPGAWDQACYHARLWGRLYTDLHMLDEHHILLVFRPAPDERWRNWEAVRQRWILEEVQGKEHIA